MEINVISKLLFTIVIENLICKCIFIIIRISVVCLLF